jgi:hypothetical protein
MLRTIHQFKIDHPYMVGTAEVVTSLILGGTALIAGGAVLLVIACSRTYCGGPVF